ncbi:MAG: mitochondrial fission ELM1 family protein [Pseudomonadota bacterium]|nr:mitochondrial fission ELM1 family protein [Pseudomonadota bacterium]
MTDGKAGTENPCLGLAEAMGLEPVVKRIRLRTPWRQLSPLLRPGARYSFSPSGDRIQPPWPDILITSGRAAVMAALAMRQQNPGTFVVHVQDPRISARHFDAVIVHGQDRIRGPNVIVITGALTRVTPQRLEEAAARFRDSLTGIPSPRVAVLVGGSSRVWRMTPAVMGKLVEQLQALVRDQGVGLMVTASRRTGEENATILRQGLKGLPGTVLWDGQGDNPLFGYLGLADAVIVTGDSISMLSEACSTGKPVYIVDLKGGSEKFRAFHRTLYAGGYAQPFTGQAAFGPAPQLDDTALTAAEVWRRYREK